MLFGLTLVQLTYSMGYFHSLFVLDVLESYIFDLCIVIDACFSLSVPTDRTWWLVGWWNTLTPLDEESIMLAMTPDDLSYKDIQYCSISTHCEIHSAMIL